MNENGAYQRHNRRKYCCPRQHFAARRRAFLDARVRASSVNRARMSQDEPKEYNLLVQTNDIHAAIAQAASALYELVEEALQAHEDHEAEECEFELFARDILGVLGRHADQLDNREPSWSDDPEGDELSS